MGSSRSRVATTIVVGLLVAACASSASPAPITTLPPATTSPPASSLPATSPATGQIAAGYQYTCALTSGDGVRCWGSNSGGQLGNGTTTDSNVPVNVTGLGSGVSKITAGGFHACALTTAGGVKCWGSNSGGQLGDGTNVDSSIPVDVVGLASGVTTIDAGGSDTCAITSVGSVKCWGDNHFGKLGNGTTNDSNVPVDVAGLASGITAIAAGTLHTCALTTGGGATCWGDGQSDDPNLYTTSVPVGVPGLASGVTSIAADLNRTCALTSGGGIMCWGPNYGAPAGEVLPDRFVPVDVSLLAGGVTSIAVGETHLCVLTSRGAVACQGNNSYGQLGDPTATGNVLSEVAGLTSAATAIAVGGMHTCALTDGGDVKCWGSNYVPGSNFLGVLGDGTACSSSSAPLDVQLDAGDAIARATPKPTDMPGTRIEHATGPTDVVLRFGYEGRGFSTSELGGESFIAGPTFTLYGDGTVIFQGGPASTPDPEGPIVRARPFLVTHLDEAHVQTLLRFAIGEGGLADACERYETQDVDGGPGPTLTIQVEGLHKRVVIGGPSPLGPLLNRLSSFDPGSAPTDIWRPDRHWGGLFGAADAISIGLLPDPGVAGLVAWPWPDIPPEDFVERDEGGYIGSPRRVMSEAEASVLGLSDNGGVVKRAYVLGPDGKTIYVFSLWPMLPDETG
jgi:alpha-tubulin suppressor-like RCC1 family protein